MKQITKKYQYESFVPYRICPLGAHLDHQLGIITGLAIDRGIKMKYNKTLDGTFKIKSYDFFGEFFFNYDKLPKLDGTWKDYLIGSILALKEEYDISKGIDIYIEKSLPIGGLASSSAIIISYILAITKVNNIILDEKKLILLVVKVENKYLNTKVGIMDPSCEVYGKKNSLLYLDTKDNSYKLIEKPQNINFKICLIYSGVSRKLTNTMYNVRVDECKASAFLMNSINQNAPIEFKNAYLRNFSYDDLIKNKHYFPMNYMKRSMHFYSEMNRIEKGIEYFKNGDLKNFGKLIFESGTSSIENYETGSPQLESLHTIAQKIEGIYGGRFSGAGFNGYYMAIINPNKEKEIEKYITDEYLNLYPQYRDSFKIYFCDIGEGVKI